MREQVCIVLNERESSKAKAAETLENRLRQANITTSRMKVERNIESLVRQRCPPILVVDYLLGDYSTGLDIMTAFDDLPLERRPSFLFYTDEPSVQVAVQALTRGAKCYVELDDPQGVHKVLGEILNLTRQSTSLQRRPIQKMTLEDLVSVSTAMGKATRHAREVCQQSVPVLVVFGPSGSGLSAMAEASLRTRGLFSQTLEIDCRGFDGSLIDVAGLAGNSARVQLGKDLVLLLDHFEEDDGELLSIVLERASALWPSGDGRESCITICTSSKSIASSWSQVPGAATVMLPTLKDRTEDIAPLVQRFLREAETFLEKKVKLFNAETLKWLSQQDWPGEIRQLRAVVIDAAISSILNESDPRSCLEERRELWFAEHSLLERKIDPLEAAVAFEVSGGNYRIAAARLGCSIGALHKQLRGAE